MLNGSTTVWQIRVSIVGLLFLVSSAVCAKPSALFEQDPMDELEQSILDPIAVESPFVHFGLRPSKPSAREKDTASQMTVVTKTSGKAKIEITVDQPQEVSDSPKTVAVDASNPEIVVDTEDAEIPCTIGTPRKANKISWPHSVSLGKPYSGYLYNPVQLKNSERLAVRKHKNYATAETVAAIEAAIDAVHEVFPDSPRLPIGNLSRKAGGRFPPHKSHQNGRDADIGYFLKVGHHQRHLKLANKRTIDAKRTWIFLESMIKRGELQMAFVDYRLQGPMYRYATKQRGWTPEQMKRIMAYPNGRGRRAPIIRHLRGHADHMHVRFYTPDSIAAVDELISRFGNKILRPMPVFTRVRSGDSLWKLARRHKTSVAKLRRWNGRKKTRILRPRQRLIIGWRRPSIAELKGSI